MGKKQFDHIDNRIREAAENSEPPFDELAWARMEVRLEKEDKKKWRLLFWWFVLPMLFIASGSLYYFTIYKPAGKLAAQHQQKSMENKSTGVTAVTPALTPRIGGSDKQPGADQRNVSQADRGGEQAGNSNTSNSNKEVEAGFESGIQKNNKRSEKGKVSSGIIAGVVEEGEDNNGEEGSNSTIKEIPPMNSQADEKGTVVVNDAPIGNDSSENSVSNKLPGSNAQDKLKDRKPSRFYFLASIGADAPNVKPLSFSNTTITARYGVGVGYQLSSKISLQTGFYASNKKYIAGPDDYKTKYGTYWSNVKIVKVDGNCLVYDIPLTVSYNVLQKPRTGYYIAGGLSSYIMKKETYDYYYIKNNVPHQATKTYTGNRNLFSVFNLGAGIEKKLSTCFYLRAEPSLSIPIAGVGEGSVKLYSTTLQVAIKYQPARRYK